MIVFDEHASREAKFEYLMSKLDLPITNAQKIQLLDVFDEAEVDLSTVLELVRVLNPIFHDAIKQAGDNYANDLEHSPLT